MQSLFAQATTDDLERMRQAAIALNAGSQISGITWEWAPHHAAFPGALTVGTPEILLATIVIDAKGSGDWFEFDIDVEWTPLGQLAVVAAVNVACYCDTDHATHYIDELTLTVDHSTSLGEAFEAATRQMIAWLGEPQSASWWRAKAGLPNP